MKVGLIDLDGVCADFCNPFKAVLNRCHGSYLDVAVPPPMWFWDKHYWGEETTKMAWDQVLRVDPEGFWGNLPIQDHAGMVRLIWAMDAEKVNPYFVTTRPFKHAEKISKRWLEKAGVADPQVIQSKKKAAIARGIGCEFAIEDNADNARFILREMGTACRVYLVKYPYNQELWDEPYIITVNSLDDALQREGF